MIDLKCIQDENKSIIAIPVLIIFAIAMLGLISEFVSFQHPARLVRIAILALVLSLFLKHVCKGSNNG